MDVCFLRDRISRSLSCVVIRSFMIEVAAAPRAEIDLYGSARLSIEFANQPHQRDLMWKLPVRPPYAKTIRVIRLYVCLEFFATRFHGFRLSRSDDAVPNFFPPPVSMRVHLSRGCCFATLFPWRVKISIDHRSKCGHTLVVVRAFP